MRPDDPALRRGGKNAPAVFMMLREALGVRTMPSNAARDLSRQTLEDSFAELAERERAAREELERAERDMEELNRIGVALSAQHDLGALLQMIVEKARLIS